MIYVTKMIQPDSITAQPSNLSICSSTKTSDCISNQAHWTQVLVSGSSSSLKTTSKPSGDMSGCKGFSKTPTSSKALASLPSRCPRYHPGTPQRLTFSLAECVNVHYLFPKIPAENLRHIEGESGSLFIPQIVRPMLNSMDKAPYIADVEAELTAAKREKKT